MRKHCWTQALTHLRMYLTDICGPAHVNEEISSVYACDEYVHRFASRLSERVKIGKPKNQTDQSETSNIT